MNIEHPVFTSGVNEDWHRSGSGQILHWPVDNYFYPGARDTLFAGCEVKKQHHTLSQIRAGCCAPGSRSRRWRRRARARRPSYTAGDGGRDERPMMLNTRSSVGKTKGRMKAMKIAVITGASSGMGLEFAKAIDREEQLDELWLIARREDRLRELAKTLRSRCRILALDLSKPESFEEYSAALESEKHL